MPKQPIIILVQPQLGENIGMCARAMLNCGLDRLRLVCPRDGWPNERAVATSAGAYQVIDSVEVFETVADAVADCTRVFATTARNRARQLPAVGVSDAVEVMDDRCGILFGPEASGLDNDSLSHADHLLDLPINPNFSSLNLSQAVLLVGWEWRRKSAGAALERTTEEPAPKMELSSFLNRLETELETGRFFLSDEMRPETVRNLRAFFGRATPTQRELRMLHGVVTALTSRDKT